MKPTLLQLLGSDVIPEHLNKVSRDEQRSIEQLVADIGGGSTVVPAGNCGRYVRPMGIGRGLRTKVNANIGSSSESVSEAAELEKLRAAVNAGADAVMDLSSGGDVRALRSTLLAACDIPFGTVPIYEATVTAREKTGSMVTMAVDDLMSVVECQAAGGVDFMTIHAGLTRSSIDELLAQGRLMDVVSRGGAFMIAWMLHNDSENPFYEHFDQLMEIMGRWDVTLSLGDGLRPGCIADASDRAQFSELVTLGQLAKRAREAGIQAIIEGPGHIPLQEIEANVKMAKKLTSDAPLYVLGPLVTDVAPGYDHVTAAIGGALAGSAGADFLCYVTSAEHLGLPGVEDVRQAVVVSRIAAHAADIAKGVPGAIEWDRQMAMARKSLDWDAQINLSIDPDTARDIYDERHSDSVDGCSMCGDLCAMKVVSDYLGVREGGMPGC